MGSGGGYEYKYRFWVDEDIIHRYTHFKLRDDIKFLFEMRTKFILKKGGYSEEIIDTERFEIGSEDSDPSSMNFMFSPRLGDYWFSHEETRELFPLILMNNRNAFDNVEKSPYQKLSLFLRGTDIYLARVQGPEIDRARSRYLESFESMYKDKCYVCGHGPKVGEQIAILVKFCGHAFHYHCFISSMLNHTSCPRCSYSLSAAVEEEEPIFQDYNSMAKYEQI